MAGTGRKFRFHGQFKKKREAVEHERHCAGCFILGPGHHRGRKSFLVVSKKK